MVERYPGKKPLSASFESPGWTQPGLTNVLELATQPLWKEWRDRTAGVGKGGTTGSVIPPTPSTPVSAPAPPSGTLASYGQAKSEIRSGPQGIYSLELQAQLDRMEQEKAAERLRRIRESRT